MVGKCSLKQAKEVGTLLNVNFKNVSVKTLRQGILVELEHGKINKTTNVTNDDLIMTAKIALAHIVEFPDYYERLEKLEEQAKKYWSNKEKPSVFL